MWQEIIVGILVVASALFIGKRIWKSFKRAGAGNSDCGCGCSNCSLGGDSTTDCRPGGGQGDGN